LEKIAEQSTKFRAFNDLLGVISNIPTISAKVSLILIVPLPIRLEMNDRGNNVAYS
jgi:hypothetical protein